jgi:hypothetical protein
MPLYAEVCVAFAQPIALPSTFNARTLGAMMKNLEAYEPTLFSLAASAAEGGELPEAMVKRARLASSVLQMDEEKVYEKLKYVDVVEGYDFGGALMSVFEEAAAKVLGKDHGVSMVLQKRFGEADEEGDPVYAMYLVHKSTMVTPEDVVYDEIRVPCEWYMGLDFTEIPVEKVDAAKTKDAFERLCRCFGLEARGNAGWKVLTSVGEASRSGWWG